MKEYLLQFPKAWQFNVGTAIDEAIKAFSRNNREIFTLIKRGVIASVNGINDVLAFIPWWIFIIIVALLGWRLSGKKKSRSILCCYVVFCGQQRFMAAYVRDA